MKVLYAVLLTVMAITLVWTNDSYSAGKPSFVAKLTGNQESPPVKTKAHATAFFYVSKDKDRCAIKIMADDIKDVTKAHLHLAPKGKNGDPVAELSTKSGKISGNLGEGTIKAADLQGPLAGKTIGDLMEKIKAGEVYVNVHTDQHKDGEMRGQVH
jgi:hypothetical protein